MRKYVVILGAAVELIGTAVMLVAGLPLNLPAVYEQDSDKKDITARKAYLWSLSLPVGAHLNACMLHQSHKR